ncbi:MAG: radical SAM protein [Candidatus Omnitrophota bacterium]|nr:radical SAM protein [Candidatus Omnitrophota bacterium]
MSGALFYYHHFGGLGHGSRIRALCRALKQEFPVYRLYVINSGKPQPELGINRYAKVFNLPPFTARSGLFRGLHAESGVLPTFHRRRALLGRILKACAPELVIIEHFPFGRNALEEEIIFLLKELRMARIPAYAAVRDIVCRDVSSRELKKRLFWFKAFFCHADKKMGFIHPFGHLAELERKIILTGRVMDVQRPDTASEKRRLGIIKRNVKNIIVSTGGGIDGSEIIRKAIEAKALVDEHTRTAMLAVTGPSCDGDIYRNLADLAGRNNGVMLERYLADLPRYIRAADLYITMAGYNSVNNALWSKTNTLFFPRRTDREQVKRCSFYKNAGRILDYRSVSSRELSGKMLELLRAPNKARYECDLEGAQKTARIINSIINLKTLKVRLTTKCNCRCDMCGWRAKKEELDFKAVIKIIDDSARLNISVLNFTGGEPTLYRRFRDVLAYAKRRDLNLSLSTNGIVPSGMLPVIKEYFDFIDVSLDSSRPEVNDRIRGRNGAFKRSLEFIRAAGRFARRLHINVTVRPDNVGGLNKMVVLLAGSADSISFTLMDITYISGRQRCLNAEERSIFYLEEVPRILLQAHKHGLAVKIVPFFNALENKSYTAAAEELLSGRARYQIKIRHLFTLPRTKQCPRARNELRVNSDGSVSPCCFLDDQKDPLGNIHNSGLIEILSSRNYADFVKHAAPHAGLCRSFCRSGWRFYEH